MSDLSTGAPIAQVRDAGPVGMITLRGDLSDTALAGAVTDATRCTMPEVRRITAAGDCALGWMSPDELLILCPHRDAADKTAALSAALAGNHALAVEVSDARAVFDLSGPGAREVLAKICPVDLAPGIFEPGELRRTRAAQVAAAFWMTGEDAFRIVCFRSVADYVREILETGAAAGGDVGYF